MEEIHKESSKNINNKKEDSKFDESIDEKESTCLKSHSEKESEQIYKLKNKKKENEIASKQESSAMFIILFFGLAFCISFYDPRRFPRNNKLDYSKIKDEGLSNLFPKSKKNQGKVPTCQEGFYVPTGYQQCFKCSILNCSKCEGNIYNDRCLSCMNSFIPYYDEQMIIKKCSKPCEKGENEKCLTCLEDKCGSCHKGYNLVNGKCILNHSIRGIYESNIDKENILLINENYIKYIREMIIDGKPRKKISYNYTFRKVGIHTVIILLNTTNLDSGEKMFFNVTKLISINFTRMFNTDKMKTMRKMFKDCNNLISIGLSEFKTGKVEDFSFMFDNCSSLSYINISNFDTKNAKDISNMFLNCKSLKTISFKNFGTNQIINMAGLFSGCSSLISLDLSCFNTENCKYMSYMFSGCSSLNVLNISSFKTENVQDISYMFKDCSNLKSLDLQKFNSYKVINMEGTFMGCAKLTSIDLSSFHTPNIQNINKIFFGCNNLKNIDISHFKIASWNKENKIFDSNIGKNGKIILKRKFYKIIKENIPIGWEKTKLD